MTILGKGGEWVWEEEEEEEEEDRRGRQHKIDVGTFSPRLKPSCSVVKIKLGIGRLIFFLRTLESPSSSPSPSSIVNLLGWPILSSERAPPPPSPTEKKDLCKLWLNPLLIFFCQHLWRVGFCVAFVFSWLFNAAGVRMNPAHCSAWQWEEKRRRRVRGDLCMLAHTTSHDPLERLA